MEVTPQTPASRRTTPINAHRGLVDDGRERDKRQTDTAGCRFAGFFALRQYKAQCGKYTDTGGSNSKLLLAADNQACAAEVGFLQVRKNK